jgi:hypothetical protein
MVHFAATASRGVMPIDDFQNDPPQPPVPHAAPAGRWPAGVLNVFIWVLGFAVTWVMMAIGVMVVGWLVGPTTIGTPATPP